MHDVYVEWREEGDGWSGFFEFNAAWLHKFLAQESGGVLLPGGYEFVDDGHSRYPVQIGQPAETEPGIFRVEFHGSGEQPLPRKWNRARDVRSAASAEELIMERVREQASEKEPGGCALAILILAAVASSLLLLVVG